MVPMLETDMSEESEHSRCSNECRWLRLEREGVGKAGFYDLNRLT